ncbi:rCG54250, partial [Rattus norvegicus]
MLLKARASLGTHSYFVKYEGLLSGYPGLHKRPLWAGN